MPEVVRTAVTRQAEKPLCAAQLGLVDAAPIPEFDSIIRLAAQLFDVPVSLISIVESHNNRQYFTSLKGLADPWAEARQTPLSHSFCKIVQSTNAPLAVSDARTDRRVQNNLAIKELGVISYLGVPIQGLEDFPLGALCVISTHPRDWSAQDVVLLQNLASCVADEIQLRASIVAGQAKHRISERYHALRESISASFILPDLTIEQRYTETLRAGCRALGYETGLIARVDCNTKVPLFSFGLPEDSQARVRPPAPLLADRVISGESLLCVPDILASAFPTHRTLDGRIPGAYAAAPLFHNGMLYGLFELSNSTAHNNTSGDEALSILSMMSMYFSAHLGLLGEINMLRRTEAAMAQYILESKEKPQLATRP